MLTKFLLLLTALGLFAFRFLPSASSSLVIPECIDLRYQFRDRGSVTPQCFTVLSALTVTLSTGQSITIPAGFVTDFASVPKFLWGIFPPIGTHNLADVIHDYLYTYNLLTLPRLKAGGFLAQ